jgi:8-oxo-dGTP diphosphatase
MDTELAAFLDRHAPGCEESAVWCNGSLPLRVTAYLGSELPPMAFVTSIRSLVFQEDSLLVLRNRDGTHILPGGRREDGETIEATLHRELLEETGWTVTRPAMLGWMHFHHLAPKPREYPYPHPDFVQIVYMAEAVCAVPAVRPADEYEQECSFRPIMEVRALDLAPAERLYLDAALTMRRPRGNVEPPMNSSDERRYPRITRMGTKRGRGKLKG